MRLFSPSFPVRTLRWVGIVAFLCPVARASAAPAPPPEKNFVRDTGFTYGAWRSCILGGGGYLQNVVACPTNPRRFYAYVDVGGVFRSDDGGQSWRMLHGHLPAAGSNYCVRGMLVDPRDDKKIMVATGGPYGPKQGIYLSEDAGETWHKALDAYFEGNAGNRSSGFILTRHPKNPAVVVAFSSLDGVFRSEDNGRTWHHGEGADGLYASDVRFDWSNGDHLWLCAGGGKVKGAERQGGFYDSTDGGAHWQKVPTEGTPSELVQDPKEPGLVYGLFNSSMVKLTRDGGKTWTDFSDGLNIDPTQGKQKSTSKTGYRALAAGPDFILTATTSNSEFFRLKSGASKWEKIPRQSVHWGDWFMGKRQGAANWVFGAALGSITVDPHDANHWFCTDYFAIYQTFDAGKNWTLTNDGIEVTVLHALTQDPADPATVHLGMADCGCFISGDGGARFEPTEGMTDNCKSIALSRQDPARVYAVGPDKQGWESNRVFLSVDRGHHWTRSPDAGLPDMAAHHCNSIAVDPRDPQAVYLAVSKTVGPGDGGVYRSKDGGKSWEWYGQGLAEGQEFFHHEIWTVRREIAVGGGGGLAAMSMDGRGVYYRAPGENGRWNKSDFPGSKVWSVAAVPAKTDRFLLGSDAGVFLSDDGGKTWQRICDKGVHDVVADEARPARMAAGTADGIVLSEDGGATWRELDRELPNRVHSLVAFAGDRLIAGSNGNGAFWMPLTPAAAQPVKTAAAEPGNGAFTRVENPAAALAVASSPAAEDVLALPTAVAATDPALHYSGRFTREKAPACQWPASAVTLHFSGTDLNVRLADNNGQSRWQIVLDGKGTGTLALQKGTHTYRAATGLPDGAHTAQLVKCTESFFGVTRIQGFELNAGGRTLPAEPPRHRIEVIGDSISCGYGDEAASQNEHFTPATENAWLAYGAVAARLLGADYTCIAWSGKKLWPNNSIVDLYNLTLPLTPGGSWDFKGAPAPEVVVITLGTNDIGKAMPEEAGWIAAYKAFIARVRQDYPGVTVYCANSPMLNAQKRPTLDGWLTKIVADLTAAGDTKVHLVDFAMQSPKNGLGGDYHPSKKTHEIMGEQLAAIIKKDLGW